MRYPARKFVKRLSRNMKGKEYCVAENPILKQPTFSMSVLKPTNCGLCIQVLIGLRVSQSLFECRARLEKVSKSQRPIRSHKHIGIVSDDNIQAIDAIAPCVRI